MESSVVTALTRSLGQLPQKNEEVLFQRSLVGVALCICAAVGIYCESLWPSRSAFTYASVAAVGLVPASAIVGKLIWPSIQNRMARSHNLFRRISVLEQQYHQRDGMLRALPLPLLDKSVAFMENYEEFCTATTPLRVTITNSTYEISSITVTCTHANQNVML